MTSADLILIFRTGLTIVHGFRLQTPLSAHWLSDCNRWTQSSEKNRSVINQSINQSIV